MQKFDAGGSPVGPASDRAIHFNAMNPTGYAQIVEELAPDGGGGWQVPRTSTIGLDVISTSAASGDRGLLHSYDSDAPMAMLYDAGGSVRALFSPEPGAGSFSPAFVELDDDPGRADDDETHVRIQVFDYDAFGQLIRVTAGIGGPSNGPPAIDPGGVPTWRFAANTPNSEFAAAHANFSLSTLLYRGEQFDAHLRMQYLRARHYDQATGRFTRLDPFAGTTGEPLTLHKYGYAGGEPINRHDPEGKQFSYVNLLATSIIGANLGATIGAVYAYRTGKSVWRGALLGAGIGAILGAGAYVAWLGASGVKSGALVRFSYDPRSFSTISKGYWQRMGGAHGRSLHHWLFPQRWSTIPEGIKNAGFNLLNMPKILPGSLSLNSYMGFALRWGGNRLVVARVADASIRVLIPASAGATFLAGKWVGEEVAEEAIIFADGSRAVPLRLTEAQVQELQEDASQVLQDGLKEENGN